VIVIHGTEEVAVQAQPVPVLTFRTLNAEVAETVTLVVERMTLHNGAACVTEKTRPPIVSVPVRAAFDVLASIAYWTVPFPEPLPPLVTVSHEAELVAVQEQAPAAVTVTDPDEAAEPEETELGTTEMSHVPACVTVTTLPAIVSVPVRGAVPVFAATWNVTPALPVLFGPAPDVTVIHDALLDAVQTQATGIVTETIPVPPAASNDGAVGETVAVQGAGSCVMVNSSPPTAIVPTRETPARFSSTV
jgi:hypothetical protein